MLGQRLIISIVLACASLVAANLPVTIRRVEDLPPIEAFQNGVSYRLPNNTRPISYDVQITTNIHTQTDFGFSGIVAVRFVAVETSRTITLHQRQLNIGAVSLTLANNPNQIYQLNPFDYDNVTEFLTFTLSSEDLVINSEYILTIHYQGTLRSDNAGFYRSSYLASDGSRRYINIQDGCCLIYFQLSTFIFFPLFRWHAVTQFETLDARHAFPCYDEPAKRAYFTLQITHGSIYHALSNMPTVAVNEG